MHDTAADLGYASSLSFLPLSVASLLNLSWNGKRKTENLFFPAIWQVLCCLLCFVCVIAILK
jgi:hypothetical protein